MDIINDNSDYLDKVFNNVYAYPNIDEDFSKNIFKKKEFFSYQIKHMPEINTYNKLEEYRRQSVSKFKLTEYQQMLANYFNPSTPFNALLLFHGLGTGKTCCAINIASNFYDQIKKYNTRIHILVPGPVLKEGWINEIKNSVCSNNNFVDNHQIFETFNILSYKSFHKRVLGEKIVNKDTADKSKYKKNDSGEILRNESYNKIETLDNTLLIVDEAHNITGNEWTLSIKKILAVSKNLKILLLTGTPMKNAANDLISLLEIMNIANKDFKKLPTIFTGDNHTLDFSAGGEEKLKQLVRGKFSYIAGGDKYLFAKRNDIGIIPKSLKFTKVIPVKFSIEQYQYYKSVVKVDDSGLARSSNDVCNFLFPSLIIDKKSRIEFSYGKTGLIKLISDDTNNHIELNNALANYIKARINKTIDPTNLVYVNNGQLTGRFLHKDYLKLFSPKFNTALSNIQSLVEGKKGPKTAFIYSNLVKIGINMFKQVLIQNGFVEFNDNVEKTVLRANDDSVCYYCGVCKKNHKETRSHSYYPATFIVITGDNENEDDEEKKKQRKIIDEVFSSNENREGKYIKLILGSKVISEGYNTRNLMEVHILDVYYNFARIDQVVGRAIRKNSHRYLYSEKNPYPVVNVYKYCMVEDEPTNEELLYQKAEKKHAMIKYVEHIIKNEAIDKYLNYEWNYSPNKSCISLKHGKEYDDQVIKDKEKVCLAENDYLSESYYSAEDKEFIDKINANKKLVDTSTFTTNMIQYEIKKCKAIIKSMYLLKYVYTLEEIIEFVKEKYDVISNFDVFYVYKALDDLIPLTDNDFNNFDSNVIVDKYNRPGYLIYVNNYYVFQSFTYPEITPMYYRMKELNEEKNNVSLIDFMQKNMDLDKYFKENNNDKEYDFISVFNYYNNRKQNDIIGIIDKEPDVKKRKKYSELRDTFKLRDKITMKTDLKRKTGLQTYTGAVCYNAYTYEELLKKAKHLGIKLTQQELKSKSRGVVCNHIKDLLLKLEKYSTDNTTYCIIPENHPVYEFPYNLKDRCKFITNKISNKITTNITVEKDKTIDGYKIFCNDNKNIDKNFMLENKFNLVGKVWTRIVN